MCGIFGIISSAPTGVSPDASERFRKMMVRSERRGKDASGILIVDKQSVYLQKSNKPGSELVKSKAYLQNLQRREMANTEKYVHVLMGHTRMSTHGDNSYANTQPIVCSAERFFLFHNGIAVNWKELEESILLGTGNSLSDSTIILKCFEALRKKESSVTASFSQLCKILIGANNLVLIDTHTDRIYFYTSNGSLFFHHTNEEIVYGSDQAIVMAGSKALTMSGIKKIQLNEVVRIQLNSKEEPETIGENAKKKLFHEDKKFYMENDIISKSVKNWLGDTRDFKTLESSIDYAQIFRIKRCTKCIIPATYPNITFNKDGICSLCIGYKQHTPMGAHKLLEKIREAGGKVLVPLSGGRDSAYALHFLQQFPEIEFVTYTYDWGFVTNLARENVSKICGKLGIEHILEAADLSVKRRNVTKNLRAWLAKPDIGLIPILMAGDKEFLTKAEIVRTENSLGISLFAMNQFERTGFKSGFAGVVHSYDKKRFHGLSVIGRFRLLAYYGLGLLRNPRYANASILDSIVGFFSFYTVSTNYIQIFDYIDWDESLVENTLIDEYGWSKPDSGKSLWRTGDATSAFYNYLYLRYAGFSEFDTFRSNQVRAGVLTRQKALELCAKENQVRISEIKTYLETVNVPVAEVLKGLEGWGSFSK